MTADELARLIDLTILRPEATEKDVAALAESAHAYPYASVCVPPCHTSLAASILAGSAVRVSTVVGFPLGFCAPGVKLVEADAAVRAGAAEVDAVMNISYFKSGGRAKAVAELSEITREFPELRLKVIIEAALLTDMEKAQACALAMEAGAAFVKTSTGFGPGGATVEDVRLLKEAAGGRIGVKAAGGIKDLKTALAMIGAGATRVGTSSGERILEELKKTPA